MTLACFFCSGHAEIYHVPTYLITVMKRQLKQ